MAHRILLTDEEYAILAEAAKERGQSLTDVVREAIMHYAAPRLSATPIGQYSYPTGEPTTPEDDAEEEAIARRIGSRRPWLSEMVIEDRGPR